MDSATRQGKGSVFPEVERIKNRYLHYVSSSWFPGYRKRCGIEAERVEKAFRSFRHTVADGVQQHCDLPGHFLSEHSGHRNPDITAGRCGKGFDPRTLLEKAVVKLGYYGIDLSHLKTSKWVPNG